MRRFLCLIFCATLAGVVSVYGEVEAVKIGYTIRQQEEVKSQALDRARALKYNIAHLKAPHNLERRLLAQRIQLESPKQWQTLVMSGSGGVKRASVAAASSNQLPLWGRFLIGTAQAEAKES